MKKIKPYWLFWIFIPPLILLGIYNSNSAIDIPSHDTYYVISTSHIFLLIILILFISGSGYLLKKIRLNFTFIIVHCICTLLGITMIFTPFIFIGMPSSPSKYNAGFNFVEHVQDLNNVITYGIIVFIFGIITYLFNLGFTIFKK